MLQCSCVLYFWLKKDNCFSRMVCLIFLRHMPIHLSPSPITDLGSPLWVPSPSQTLKQQQLNAAFLINKMSTTFQKQRIIVIKLTNRTPCCSLSSATLLEQYSQVCPQLKMPVVKQHWWLQKRKRWKPEEWSTSKSGKEKRERTTYIFCWWTEANW
mgnify:CR=1 FL=1